MWPEYTYRSQAATTRQSVRAWISSIYLPLLVTLRPGGLGIYVTLICYMHHAATRSHTTHIHSVQTNTRVCAQPRSLPNKKKALIAWAAELSWGLEAPFESATVVDLEVKVPPGVVGSGKKATEDLLLGASSSTWPSKRLGRCNFLTLNSQLFNQNTRCCSIICLCKRPCLRSRQFLSP